MSTRTASATKGSVRILRSRPTNRAAGPSTRRSRAATMAAAAAAAAAARTAARSAPADRQQIYANRNGARASRAPFSFHRQPGLAGVFFHLGKDFLGQMHGAVGRRHADRKSVV